MSFSFKRAGTTVALGTAIGAAGLLAVALAFAVGIAMWAAIGALWALLAMFLWNAISPEFAFVPVAYQHIGFMTMWGIVLLLSLLRRVLFGSKKGGK